MLMTPKSSLMCASAASQAFNLAMELGWVTEDTVVPLITKAAQIAHGVALKLDIIIPEFADQYVSKAVPKRTLFRKQFRI